MYCLKMMFKMLEMFVVVNNQIVQMKKVLFLLFLVGINPLFAQKAKPKCLDGNCKNGVGTYIYEDSSVYVGAFTDRIRNGQGKITYKSGATYEGEWMNDKRHGKGVFIDSLKNRYEGAWLDDKENGVGKYTDAKGNVYEGTWTNGELQGYITLRYKNKNLYVGEYDKGLKGKGKFTYADGSIYTGNFNRNKRSGYGELVYHFGLTYKGNWVSNEIEGQGDFFETKSQKKLATGLWKTEKSKEGDLNVSNSEGYLFSQQVNKEIYFGQSKNGIKDGFGTLIKTDKTVLNGYWENGKFLGVDKPSYQLINLNCSYRAEEVIKDCKLVIISNFNQESRELEGEDDNRITYFGLIDFTGKTLLEMEFDVIHRIKNSCLFIVRKKGSYFLFKVGSGLIPFNYKVSSDYESTDYYEQLNFNEGLCLVKDQYGKIGFIDETGKEVIKCSYSDSRWFSEGLCSVFNGVSWGVINKKGELVVPFSYSRINEYSEGMALVVKGSKYGYIDKLGKIIIPLNFEFNELEFYDYNFKHGLAIYYQKGKEEGFRFIDKSGKFVGELYSDIDSWFHLSSNFELFTVAKKFPAESAADKLHGYSTKFGITNKLGQIVVPVSYVSFELKGNYIISQNKDLFGLIDAKGNVLMEAKFSKEQVLTEISKKETTPNTRLEKTYIELNGVRKVGLENAQGKVIVTPIYDKIIEMRDGIYKCVNGDKCFLLFF